MLEAKINESDNTARIIVARMGGAGNNVINRMAGESITGVEFVGVNTNKQTLQFCKVPTTMQIGEKPTKGLSAGTRPGVGEKAAEESSEEISQALKGADMVFVTCGMGGSTGTGAAPVVTKIAKDVDILAIGVVTKSFHFEAKTRMSNALEGIENLKDSANTLIMVPDDRLLEIVDRRTIIPDVLKKTDGVLQQVIQGVTDPIDVPGLISLDFADVQTVMTDKGIAHTDIDKAKDDDRAIEAVKQAVSSLLLETTIGGADHAIINISNDISLIEANEVASYVQELAGDKANITFGAMYDESARDGASITVITTDLDKHGVDASVSNAMKGLTSSSKIKPNVAVAAAQAPHAAASETVVTASPLYSRQNQGCIPNFNPSPSGSQGCNPSRYSLSQGYNTSNTQNPAPALSQLSRPATNKEMQINISDSLKNKR